MPEVSDLLLTIAEVSIAMIAFAAIVLVLRQLVGGGLSTFHVLILQLYAVIGFSVLFLSFLPLVLHYVGVPTSVLWRLSSALLAITFVAANLWYFRRRRVVAPDRGRNAATIIGSFVVALVIPLLLLHAAGVIFEDTIGPYPIGLLAGLIPIATTFFASLEDFVEGES